MIPFSQFHIPTLTPITTEANRLSLPWLQLFTNEATLLNAGIFLPPAAAGDPLRSVVIPLVKLTGGGSNGSITVTNGIITAYTAPT